MPDFERTTDSLRVYVARTPEEKAYARGFIAGKYYARKQAAWCVAFAAAISIIISIQFLD